MPSKERKTELKTKIKLLIKSPKGDGKIFSTANPKGLNELKPSPTTNKTIEGKSEPKNEEINETNTDNFKLTTSLP
ncbi:MAG: hypothetical protein QXV44_00485 [Candidatus Anstonellaceae archaeon]